MKLASLLKKSGGIAGILVLGLLFAIPSQAADYDAEDGIEYTIHAEKNKRGAHKIYEPLVTISGTVDTTKVHPIPVSNTYEFPSIDIYNKRGKSLATFFVSKDGHFSGIVPLTGKKNSIKRITLQYFQLQEDSNADTIIEQVGSERVILKNSQMDQHKYSIVLPDECLADLEIEDSFSYTINFDYIGSYSSPYYIDTNYKEAFDKGKWLKQNKNTYKTRLISKSIYNVYLSEPFLEDKRISLGAITTGQSKKNSILTHTVAYENLDCGQLK